MDDKKIRAMFTYVVPDEERQMKHEAINATSVAVAKAAAWPTDFNKISEACLQMALVINEFCPDCADKTYAIRQLRIARNAINEAIVLRNEHDMDSHVAPRIMLLVQIFDQKLYECRWSANSAIALEGLT